MWQKDISANCAQNKISEPVIKVDKENNEEEEETLAKKWFLEGVEHEKNGQLLEAIRYYKKAVQLVPDIEFKVCDELGNKQKESSESEVLEG